MAEPKENSFSIRLEPIRNEAIPDVEICNESIRNEAIILEKIPPLEIHHEEIQNDPIVPIDVNQ